MGFGSRALPSALFNKTAAAAWHPQGGFVTRLDTNGFVLDVTRESYDQAFGLLACAWAYAVDRESIRSIRLPHLRFLDTRSQPAWGKSGND